MRDLREESETLTPPGTLTMPRMPHSRREAIRRGELVDVTETAADNRFVVPVALSSTVYKDVRNLSGEYVLSTDTEDTRLEGLLHHARYNAGYHLYGNRFEYSFYMPVGTSTIYTARLYLLPGDDGESVITISK